MPDMYVSLYLEGLKRLMGTGDRAAQDVMLMSLCQHANTFGWCYPGDELIGFESGHRKDAIPDVLTRLQLMDYIRLVYTQTPRRNVPDRDIQINPYLIALRPECHEVSAADWLGYKSQTKGDNGKQTIPITYGENDLQPPTNHLQESLSLITTTELPPPPPPEPALLGSGKVKKQRKNAGTPNAVGDSAPKAQKLPVPTAQNASANAPRPPFRAPPSPTPPRPVALPDVELIKTPLADELHERVALDMNEATGRGLSIALTRGLVAQYGTALCTTALKLWAKKTGMSNPSGNLRWMIQTGALDVEGDAREEANPYTGRYSDFIQS